MHLSVVAMVSLFTLVIELLLNFIKEMCQAQSRPFMRPANRTLPPFVKIMQNFILMQNT